MSGPFAIVLATDDAFAMPTATAAASLGAAARPGRCLDLYVLDGGMTPNVRTRLERSLRHTAEAAARRDVRVRPEILSAEAASTEGLPIRRRFSRSTYLRLLVGELLPPHVTRALYIDGDTVVFNDLAELWELDLDGAPAAAATSAGSEKYGNGKRPWAELGIDPETPYINSGVLLIDVDKWRSEGIGEAVISRIAECQDLFRWMDQDGLNAVLAGRWEILDPVWNLQLGSRVYRRDPPEPAGVGICHFTGIWKPWSPRYDKLFVYGADDPGFREAWMAAARGSGWFTPQEWRLFRSTLLLKKLAPPVGRIRSRAGALRQRVAPT